MAEGRNCVRLPPCSVVGGEVMMEARGGRRPPCRAGGAWAVPAAGGVATAGFLLEDDWRAYRRRGVEQGVVGDPTTRLGRGGAKNGSLQCTLEIIAL